MKKNVFLLGLEDSNLPTLHQVLDAESFSFHQLLTIGELRDGEVSVDDLLAKAEGVLDAFEGSVDAIVGYWDFPVSTLVPILSERYGTRITSLESVVKCEHKYWSRLEQRKVTDRLPRVGMVDLASDAPVPPDGVRFWPNGPGAKFAAAVSSLCPGGLWRSGRVRQGGNPRVAALG